MSKAKEILLSLSYNCDSSEERMIADYDVTPKRVKEAIAELEAQENNNCWECKHCLEDSNETSVWLECRCPDCPMEHNTVITDQYGEVDTDFCCNRFEPKATK